jgi:hypothetical protein
MTLEVWKAILDGDLPEIAAAEVTFEEALRAIEVPYLALHGQPVEEGYERWFRSTNPAAGFEYCPISVIGSTWCNHNDSPTESGDSSERVVRLGWGDEADTAIFIGRAVELLCVGHTVGYAMAMRVHIILDDELVKQLDNRVGRRGRSAFIERIVRRALEFDRRWEGVEEGLGVLTGREHEWDRDPAAWVSAQRHNDLSRVG